jgi:hypothetical protein
VNDPKCDVLEETLGGGEWFRFLDLTIEVPGALDQIDVRAIRRLLDAAGMGAVATPPGFRSRRRLGGAARGGREVAASLPAFAGRARVVNVHIVKVLAASAMPA